MPLITCPDCGKSISDAAPACIHCGRPSSTSVRNRDDDATPVPQSRQPETNGQGRRPASTAPRSAPAKARNIGFLFRAKERAQEDTGGASGDPPPAPADDETVYYASDAAFVSNKRVRFQGRSFNPTLITSVSCGTAPNPAAAALTAKIVGLAILGAAFLFVALIVFAFAAAVVDRYQGNVIMVGLIPAALGGLCIWRSIANVNRKKAIPPLGSVDLDTSSGMGKVAITFRYEEARKICRSIEQMLADKN